MTQNFKAYISEYLNNSITKATSVSGGDISQAYKIETSNTTYFLKLNHSANALKMFQLEANGLQLIDKTNTIKTPKILACDIYKGTAFLLLDFIEAKTPSNKDFENLGHQLSNLHECSFNNFGLDEDNFIGRLAQRNTQHTTWIDFYTNERLLPQLQLARENGLLAAAECPTANLIKNTLNPFLKGIKPSLLHGDLWSGNFIISKDGTPYLIDPAVYYGHHEIDLAMSKLFGGFASSFYDAYHSSKPLDANSEARIKLYQLYYLLVHLNMFGKSYYGSVKSILKLYF